MIDYDTHILKLKEQEAVALASELKAAKKSSEARSGPGCWLIVAIVAVIIGALAAIVTTSAAPTPTPRPPGDSVRTGPFGSQTRQATASPAPVIIVQTAVPVTPVDHAATGTAAIEAFASLFPPTWTPAATTTPQPTATPQPSATPWPTWTAVPTATPQPTGGPLVVAATAIPVTPAPLPSPNNDAQAYSDLIADMVRRQQEARLYTILAGGAILLFLTLFLVALVAGSRGRASTLPADIQALIAAVLAMVLSNGQQQRPVLPPPLPIGPPKRDPAWVQRGNTLRRVDTPLPSPAPPKSPAPSAPVTVTPSPAPVIDRDVYRQIRFPEPEVAPPAPPVQESGASGDNDPSPPNTILMTLEPANPEEGEALYRELCRIWNELPDNGRSNNAVIRTFWAGDQPKNQNRNNQVNQALEWGRENGLEIKPATYRRKRKATVRPS